MSWPLMYPRQLRRRRIIVSLGCSILLAAALLLLMCKSGRAEDPYAWLDEYLPPEDDADNDVPPFKAAYKLLTFWREEKDPGLPRGPRYAEDGLVRGWDEVHEIVGKQKLRKKDLRRLRKVADRHPIEELLARGKRRWRGLLAA